MKALLYICRILVGALFIVSGLIKANDPLGFSYKLGEYFAETALNIPSLEPYALILGVIACVAEIVLGFALLVGGKINLSSWLLMGLVVFFGWLTFYTATCDPNAIINFVENGKEIEQKITCVTDCGCFGDAMKGSVGRSLTPWESFYKDLILFVLLIPVFFKRRSVFLNTDREDVIIFSSSIVVVSLFSWIFSWYFPVLFFVIGYASYVILKKFLTKEKSEWPFAITITLFSLIFAYNCYAHLPLKDYRPYAIGKNIPEQMKVPEGAPQDVYETTLVYKNSISGEVKEFTSNDYPWNDSTWVWQDTKSKLIIKGYEPAIHDLSILDYDGNDYTQDYLNDSGYIFLWISYDLSKTDKKAHLKFNLFADECYKHGISVIGLTATSYSLTEDFRHENQSMIDYYQTDELTLKTIIRSNPGLLLLKNGVVINKWHYNDLPEFKKAIP